MCGIFLVDFVVFMRQILSHKISCGISLKTKAVWTLMGFKNDLHEAGLIQYNKSAL